MVICQPEARESKQELAQLSSIALFLQAVQKARFTKTERVQFEGHGLFPAHPQHALFFENSPATASGRNTHPLPTHLLQQLRPIHLQLPEVRLLLHASLLASGFTEADTLAKLLVTLQNQGQAMLPHKQKGYFDLGRLRAIVQAAAGLRQIMGGSSSEQPERAFIAGAACRVLLPGLSQDDATTLRELIDSLCKVSEELLQERSAERQSTAAAIRLTIEKLEESPLMQVRPTHARPFPASEHLAQVLTNSSAVSPPAIAPCSTYHTSPYLSFASDGSLRGEGRPVP